MIIDKVNGVWIYPDGREVCDTKDEDGLAEYIRRRRVAWEDQDHLCALCFRRIWFCEATSDHKKPRKMGGSERDDRQENIQAACGICNSEKGSKR